MPKVKQILKFIYVMIFTFLAQLRNTYLKKFNKLIGRVTHNAQPIIIAVNRSLYKKLNRKGSYQASTPTIAVTM